MIPTLNSEKTLSPLLAQLSGKVERIVIADGGSTDSTLALAEKYDARIAAGHKGRGHQLARGASWAGECDWLLFLHSDVKLPADWARLVSGHMSENSGAAGYFAFGANAKGFRARAMEFWVSLRTFWLKWPYGDQGLLISWQMYEALGGYPEQVLFEDVALIKSLKETYGRRALKPLKGKIMTDVSAFYRDGVWKRGSRNLGLLMAYLRGESVETLAAQYK